MFVRQVRLARGVVKWLSESKEYELLGQGKDGKLEDTHMIVIFRARDEELNGELVAKINDGRRMYVSGTKWDGKPASRIAVSTWKVEVERDLRLITEVLEGIVRG